MEPTSLTLFLSPHFDDIPLSCGGIAARLANIGGYCIGITVFAEPHDDSAPLSPFMLNMHQEWEQAAGMNVQAINAVRRREEEAAMRTLGLHHEWLEFMDAPYRRSMKDGHYFYVDDPTLFGPPAPEERRRLVRQIADRVREISSKAEAELGVRGRVRVFAPLGIGRHVDHQLVYSAARVLGPRFGVLHYEDYPYVQREGALGRRLDELNLPAKAMTTPITDLIGVKIASIGRYKSQLESLFKPASAMSGAVREYTGAVAAEAGWPEGEYGERVWQMPSIYVVRS
ncbi:MAG: PIG-L family deacetylase, partial [Chloroflexia bacterium]